MGKLEQLLDTLFRMIPLGRGLCCPESNHVSGQVLVAGGGELL